MQRFRLSLIPLFAAFSLPAFAHQATLDKVKIGVSLIKDW
ncbi:Beta-lactamase TEM-12 precursor [Dickeya solani]|uniref:Uncharacterized protein n=1 Tax=Dickeya solani D s0432-1 TaxID=1231725 RepID=A0AAV3KDR1_9GAMM|nr:Beta-lactamase TEM-12 precursor [Dickeya solani]ERO58938.1 hypothetical protein A544_2119 [Dickeya solani D s0432-1]AYQ52126.1 Beta-lactamase TEM-12 precursor [Dickeya solani]NUA40127.1 Beta-lactamase TEM-12 precursor [Dickeya solani]NUA46269.1 Beta-lactamase TEM-12 precursor [Dickeya solani]